MRRENANSKLVASAGGEEKGRGSAGRQLLEGTAQAIGYFDRLDYVSPMNREHAFVLAAEKLLGIEVPRKRTYSVPFDPLVGAGSGCPLMALNCLYSERPPRQLSGV
jgi:hypothetical protein